MIRQLIVLTLTFALIDVQFGWSFDAKIYNLQIESTSGRAISIIESRPLSLVSKTLLSDTIPTSGLYRAFIRDTPKILNLKVSGYKMTIPILLDEGLPIQVKVAEDTVIYEGAHKAENFYLYLSRLAFFRYLEDAKNTTDQKGSIHKLNDAFDSIAAKMLCDDSISRFYKELIVFENKCLIEDKLRKDASARTTSSLRDSLTVHNFQLEERFINLGIENYAYLIHHRISEEIFLPMISRLVNNGYKQDSIPSMILSEISEVGIDQNSKDFLLGKANLFFLNILGLTDQTQSRIAAYNERAGKKSYRDDVNDKVFDISSLKKGDLLPRLLLHDPQGRSVSLASLEGKVLYIDIWATWCKPCLEEFPSSKELRSSFRKSDDLEFVYISIDSNKGAWKRYLTKNHDLEGYHVNQTPMNNHGDIWDVFKLTGIPRYIIVNRQGKIVTMNASRPSDPMVKEEILRELKN